MGVEVALAGAAGLGLAGNYLAGQSQERAAGKMARATERATQASLELQREGMERGLGELEKYYRTGQQSLSPYYGAGTQALSQYQTMLTPEGQAQFANQFTRSPIYQAMADQAQEQLLKGASATGGLRTGQANVGLQSIAPQLIQQAIGQRLQGLQGLTNMGASTAGQRAQLASNMGQSTAGLIGSTTGGMATTGQQGQIAQAQYAAQAAQAMPMAAANTLGQLGGLAAAYGIYGGGS